MAIGTEEYTFEQTMRFAKKRASFKKGSHKKSLQRLVAGGLVVERNGNYKHGFQVFLEKLSRVPVLDQDQMNLLVKTLTLLIKAHPYTCQFMWPASKLQVNPDLLSLVGYLDSCESNKLLKRLRCVGLSTDQKLQRTADLAAYMANTLFKVIALKAVDSSDSTVAAALLEEFSFIVEAMKKKNNKRAKTKVRNDKKRAPEDEMRDKIKLQLDEAERALPKTIESLDTDGSITSMLSDSKISADEVAAAITSRCGDRDLPKQGHAWAYLIVVTRVSEGTEHYNDAHGQDMKLQWSQVYGKNWRKLIARLSGVSTRLGALTSPM